MKLKFGGTYYNEMFKPFRHGFAELCRCCKGGMTMFDVCFLGTVIGALLLFGALEISNTSTGVRDFRANLKAGEAKEAEASLKAR